jgi:hypothetical protein
VAATRVSPGLISSGTPMRMACLQMLMIQKNLF